MSGDVYGGGTGAITYQSNRSGLWQLYQTRIDRGGEAMLTEHASNNFQPRWASDGSEFTFVSDRSGVACLWKMRPGQATPTQLTTVASEMASWSPNGAFIAYEARIGGSRDIWVMRADGSEQTQITSGPGNNRQPWWSADGSQIVFASDRSGAFELYIMDADGSDVQLLPTVVGASNREPRWSPDGSRIAFRSNNAGVDNIYLINVDGSGLTQLTTSDRSIGPMWSPDGGFVAYHTLGPVSGAHIQISNVANLGAATLTTLHTWSDAHPSWQPVSSPAAVAPLPQQQANYQLVVLSPTTGAVEAIVDGTAWHSFTYSRVLNGIGDFVVELPNDVRWQGVFVLDALVDVLRSDPANPRRLVKEETYFVRRVQQLREEPEERLIVAGRSLNHLLTRRVINPSADPLVAGGYSTKAGPADQVIRDYVLEQLGANAQPARRAANFSVAPVTNVGQSVGNRLRFENLFEVVEKLAKSGDVDFAIERVGGARLEMRIGQFGADKTRSTNYPMMRWVGLSPLRGNLTNPSLLIDRTEEANFVYALGEGQGVYRDILEVGELSANDSPWNLIEYVEDVRNVSRGDAVQLYTQARVSLADKAARQEFTFEPTGTEPGNTYRVDWDLGDTVTVLWGDYELDLRVTAVTLEAGEAAERIQVKVERP